MKYENYDAPSPTSYRKSVGGCKVSGQPTNGGEAYASSRLVGGLELPCRLRSQGWCGSLFAAIHDAERQERHWRAAALYGRLALAYLNRWWLGRQARALLAALDKVERTAPGGRAALWLLRRIVRLNRARVYGPRVWFRGPGDRPGRNVER